MTDDWSNMETLTPDKVDLPESLIALRDGTAPPAPKAGVARAERLQQMTADIAACDDVIADLDRYEQHLIAVPPQLVGPIVGPMMARHVRQLRRRAVNKKRQLRADIDTLRAQP
jgi:hypothetical protein